MKMYSTTNLLRELRNKVHPGSETVDFPTESNGKNSKFIFVIFLFILLKGKDAHRRSIRKTHMYCQCLGLSIVKRILRIGATVLWITQFRRDFKSSQVQPSIPNVGLKT